MSFICAQGFRFYAFIGRAHSIRKNLWQPLLLTDNIVGNKENSTFHCLFHGASQDISTKLTLLALYNQLNEIGYQFTSHDFLSMLKVCKNYSDSDFSILLSIICWLHKVTNFFFSISLVISFRGGYQYKSEMQFLNGYPA